MKSVRERKENIINLNLMKFGTYTPLSSQERNGRRRGNKTRRHTLYIHFFFIQEVPLSPHMPYTSR